MPRCWGCSHALSRNSSSLGLRVEFCVGSTHHLPMNVLPLLTENEKSSSFFVRLSPSISSLGILSKPSSQNATPSFVALCVHWTSQHPRLLLFASLSVQGVCVLLKARDTVLLKFTFPVPSRVAMFLHLEYWFLHQHIRSICWVC